MHAGVLGCLLGGGQLLGGNPFQPAVEVQSVRVLLAQIGDFRGVAIELALPVALLAVGRPPLVVAQAPGGVGFDLVSAFGEVTVEFGLASLGSAGLVDDPQRMLLDAPHGVAIDQPRVVIQRFGVGMQSVDGILVALAERGIFGDRLRTDVRESGDGLPADTATG